MNTARIVEMRSAGHQRHAVALFFEYMVVTLAETGRPVPASIDRLPAVLRVDCQDLATAYRAPGTVLLAYHGREPAGCLGLQPRQGRGTIEVRRLYVRPAHRQAGLARRLVDHAHQHAAREGFHRLVLDVLPSRIRVIEFYRDLGYAETEPFETESPDPMIYLHRMTTSPDPWLTTPQHERTQTGLNRYQ
jgi:GNAT superfamily N-acetyltransferase